MSQFFRSHISSVNLNTNSDLSSAVGEMSILDEMAHELRQPLSVIESLAYYLEMTSVNEASAAHLRRIQAMVSQANRVLAKACGDC